MGFNSGFKGLIRNHPNTWKPRKDSVEVSAIKLRAGWSEDRIPAGVINLFSPPQRPDRLWANPALHLMVPGFFPGAYAA